MDLQTLKANVRERKYESRQQFLSEVHQIFENSRLYNGTKSVLTVTAQLMMDLTLQRFAEVRDYRIKLDNMLQNYVSLIPFWPLV